MIRLSKGWRKKAEKLLYATGCGSLEKSSGCSAVGKRSTPRSMCFSVCSAMCLGECAGLCVCCCLVSVWVCASGVCRVAGVEWKLSGEGKGRSSWPSVGTKTFNSFFFSQDLVSQCKCIKGIISLLRQNNFHTDFVMEMVKKCEVFPKHRLAVRRREEMHRNHEPILL